MFLDILFGCLLTALGLFSVPNLVVSKKKEISPFFKKLLLYQGIAGVVICVVGVMAFIQYVLKGGTVMVPYLWLTMLLCSAGLAVLGFLLGYNLIYLYLYSKGAKTKAEVPEGEKAEEPQDKMLTHIMPLQGKIGIVVILLGVWSVMAAVMFSGAVVLIG